MRKIFNKNNGGKIYSFPKQSINERIIFFEQHSIKFEN